MEITYHLKEKDIIAGLHFLKKVSPATKINNKISIAILALVPCIRLLSWQQFSIYYIANMLFEILVLIAIWNISNLIFNQLIYRSSARVLKQKGKGVIGEHTISLTEEVFIESTSFNQSHIKWSGLTGIFKNKDYIFIMMGNLQGHSIPKRAFANHDAFTEFYDQAQTYYQNVNES
jgi:hypothetical protein